MSNILLPPCVLVGVELMVDFLFCLLPNVASLHSPQYIYGPLTNKRDYLDWFFDRVVHGLEFIPLPLHGDQLVALTHAEDVASVLAAVVGNENAVNQVRKDPVGTRVLRFAERYQGIKRRSRRTRVCVRILCTVSDSVDRGQRAACIRETSLTVCTRYQLWPLMIVMTLHVSTFCCLQVFNCASDRYITYSGLFREVGKVRTGPRNHVFALPSDSHSLLPPSSAYCICVHPPLPFGMYDGEFSMVMSKRPSSAFFSGSPPCMSTLYFYCTQTRTCVI